MPRGRSSSSSSGSLILDAVERVKSFGSTSTEAEPAATSFRFGGSLRNDVLDALPEPRKRLATMLSSLRYQKVLSAIVLLNLVCASVETDAINREVPPWVVGCNYAILSFFICEMIVKLYVYRVSFFDDMMNVADLIIVALDSICSLLEAVLDMPNISVFRAFRLVRLLRTRQILKVFPQMNTLVKGLFGAVQICFGGLLLLILVLIVFAIFGVQLFHTTSRQLAEAGGTFPGDSFDSIWHAMLSLFNIAVVGDGWNTTVRPLVEAYPPFAFFFLLLFIIVTVTLLNMMLAVIVTEAEACLNRDLADRAEQRDDEMKAACNQFRRLFEKMDTDLSGTVSFPELQEAAEKDKEFADLLFTMECDREEMEVLFRVLDKDGSGDVSIEEFSHEMYKMKSSSDHNMLIFIKAYVHEIFRKVSEQVELLNERVIIQLGNEERVLNALNKELPDLYKVRECDLSTFNQEEYPQELRFQLEAVLEEKMASIQREFSSLSTHLLRKGGTLEEEKLASLSSQLLRHGCNGHELAPAAPEAPCRRTDESHRLASKSTMADSEAGTELIVSASSSLAVKRTI